MTTTFFDDQELIRLGLSQSTVDALKKAFDNSSSSTITLLDLDETQQIALEASGLAADAANAIVGILSDLRNRPFPEFPSEINQITQRIDQILLQLAGIEDFTGRIALIETRLHELELLAHGNNLQ